MFELKIGEKGNSCFYLSKILLVREGLVPGCGTDGRADAPPFEEGLPCEMVSFTPRPQPAALLEAVKQESGKHTPGALREHFPY